MEFRLAQNRPNPFNPNTEIEFDLPKHSFVDVTVYDMLGRKVKTLVSGSMAAGRHMVSWNSLDENGQRVSSGLYFYRLKTDEFVETRKMILLK